MQYFVGVLAQKMLVVFMNVDVSKM